MKMLQISGKTIPGLLLILLTTASFCYGDQKTVEVVGISECSDCHQNNIKNSHAFKGLKVTIDCKHANGEMKTRGSGELDEEGKFRVEFPQELMENGKLKEECYAQLHSASDTPCPTYNGIESSKITFVSQSDGKHTFSPVGKLKFSPNTCTSAFLWPTLKHPFPKKPLPKFSFPHINFPFKFFHHKKPFFKKPILTPIPIYKKPFPHVPIFKKPLLPPIPIYKKPFSHVPIYKKPFPPHIPIYKKPLPPFVPIYKNPLPSVPIFKKPSIPLYKPLPKFPPHPKFPPKFFEHPKYEKLPSFPHP